MKTRLLAMNPPKAKTLQVGMVLPSGWADIASRPEIRARANARTATTILRRACLLQRWRWIVTRPDSAPTAVVLIRRRRAGVCTVSLQMAQRLGRTLLSASDSGEPTLSETM